jgi:hypothetical protein
MRKQIILSGLFASFLSVQAQGEFDVLKYSQTDISGSARYVAMSGAFGALGGDISVLGNNPAGIAVYRSSEISVTPSVKYTNAKSDFNGNNNNVTDWSGHLINNFGYVGSFRTYDESAISNFNIGISFNRIKDFNRTTTITGSNRATSFLDGIASEETNLIGSNSHSAYWDYVTGGGVGTPLVTLNSAGTMYETFADGKAHNNWTKMVETGGINEWNFSLGANYSHQLYLGLSVGVQSFDYTMQTTYEEYFGTVGGMALNNVLVTTGNGFNFKFGAIYRPIPEIRLGLAVHTPTYFNMTDVFNTSLGTFEMPDDGNYTTEGTEGYQDYQMNTPGRIIVSVAYQVGEKGFISFDGEYIDYSTIKVKYTDGTDMTDDFIQYLPDDMKSVWHLRLGGEYRLSDNLSLRVGGALYQMPVKKSLETNNTQIFACGTNPAYTIPQETYYISGGLGYHSGGFFLDFALQRQIAKEHYYPFYDGTGNSSDPLYSDISIQKTMGVATVGLKF